MSNAVKALAAENPSVYFLTVTYAPDLFTHDKIAAWEQYRDHVKPLLDALRKKYGIYHAVVLEGTKKGYPHAHIILFSPEGVFPGLEKLRDKTKIHFGELYDFIKSRVFSPVFCLEKGSPDNALSYMFKYLGKASDNDFRKLLNNHADWTNADRKNVISFLMPIIANVRRVSYSRTPAIRIAAKNAEEEREFIEKYSVKSEYDRAAIGEILEEEDFVPDPDLEEETLSVEEWARVASDSAKRGRLLIKLCTKLAENTTAIVRGCSLALFETELLCGQKETELLPSEIDAFMNKKAKAFYSAPPFLDRFLKMQGLISRECFETPFVQMFQRSRDSAKDAFEKVAHVALMQWTAVDTKFEWLMASPEEAGDYYRLLRFSQFARYSMHKKGGHVLSIQEREAHTLELEKAAELPGESDNVKFHAACWRWRLEQIKENAKKKTKRRCFK